MSYADLDRLVGSRPGVPAIVLATAGTTMTEAVDDVGEIVAVLDDRGVLDRYVHVDGALSAIPLALLPDHAKPAFDFAAGADSIGFSLHKFLATRMPGGIVIERNTPSPGVRRIPYTGAADTTVTASRNGHLALMAWYAARTLGVDGLRRRAEEARDTAAYLVKRLSEVAWPAWRNRHAFTVVLKTPPRRVATGWHLATEDNGWSHYVCLPGRGADQVDRFIGDLCEEILRSESVEADHPVSPGLVASAGTRPIAPAGAELVGPPPVRGEPACRGGG
jgi:histidine decarboxylase